MYDRAEKALVSMRISSGFSESVRHLSVLESYDLTDLNVRTVITTHYLAKQNVILGGGILDKPVLPSVILSFRPFVNISRFLLNNLRIFCPIYI